MLESAQQRDGDADVKVGATGTSSRVLASTAMLGGATMLVKLAALAKEWLVARQLGAGDDLDAYWIAFLLPSYAVVVLAQTLASAFVPTYIRVWRQSGLAAAQRLAGGVLAGAVGVLAITTLALAIAAPLILPLVGMSFDAAKIRLTLVLFYPMLGIVIASGLSALFASVLNAHERFAAVALASLAIPLGTLAVFWLYEDRFGVHALAAGTLAGFLIETALLALVAWRRGLLPLPHLERGDAALSHVGSQYVPVATAGLFASSALVVDQSMAATLGSGQVSVLNYGSKVVAVVLATVAASLSTVLLPRFSHLIAAGQFGDLKRTMQRLAAAVLLGSVPAVALLAFASEPIVRVLFQRGAFTADTTAAVAAVQLWLLPQIPFYVLAMLGARVLSAMDGNPLVLRIGVLSLVVNVAGNYVLMQWFGVRGIAMATSLVYLIATVATLLAIRLKLAEVGKTVG